MLINICTLIMFNTSVEVCDPNPCQNNGVCKILESGGFKCICKEPYFGKKCQDGEILINCVIIIIFSKNESFLSFHVGVFQRGTCVRKWSVVMVIVSELKRPRFMNANATPPIGPLSARKVSVSVSNFWSKWTTKYFFSSKSCDFYEWVH